MRKEKFSRRSFVQKTAMASTLAAIAPSFSNCEEHSSRQIPASYHDFEKLLNAYYFRAHMYTLVPHQVREDLKWMADVGTNVVSVAILEQDLRAAVENVEIIVNEAAKLGMGVFAVPSRWGGLLAGAPKVPSVFTIQNPDTWLLKADGSFYKDKNVGVHSSIHYEETIDFFKESVDKIFALWDIKGIIWDEPKIYDKKDYSKRGLERLSDPEDLEENNLAFSNFFSEINRHIKDNYPDKTTSLFAYANMREDIIDAISKIENLDYMGCDGRPWGAEDMGDVEQVGKVLLGGPGDHFQEAARQSGKKSLFLAENHNMNAENNVLMDAGLPKVIDLNPDQLIYYYYPRNLDRPDENMKIIAKHVKDYH